MASKLFLVMRQEYLNRVRTRGFLIGTALFPLFFGLLMVLPGLLMTVDVEKPTTIAVVDSTGVLFDRLQVGFPDTTEAGEKLYQFKKAEAVVGSDLSGSELISALTGKVNDEDVGGFLVFAEELVSGRGEAQFYAQNVSDTERNTRLHRTVEALIRQRRIEDSGLSMDAVHTIMARADFSTFRIQGDEVSEDEGQTFITAYVFGFIFYISIMIYGAMTLRATLEEKVERSAELMVSTVRPLHLMGGKILGITAVAVTQLLIWVIAGYLIVQQGGALPGQAAVIMDTIQAAAPPVSVYVSFFVFFILGLFFYSSLFVSIGAMVNSETEAQQLQMPVTLPVIIGFIMSFLAIRDPNAPFVVAMSLIPLFTPILMMVRIAVLPPPVWQVVLSVVILIFSTAGSVWLGGKIFRVGLLMYGKRPSLPELMKWIRYG